MATPPFDLDITDPTDTSLASDFPANERMFRDNLASYINTEHDINTGYHSFQSLSNTARNALTNPPNGMLVYNTSSNEMQINTGTDISPTWLPAFGSGGFFDNAASPTGSAVNPGASDSRTLYVTGGASGLGLTINLPDITTIDDGWTISAFTTGGKSATLTVDGGGSEIIYATAGGLNTTVTLAAFDFELITLTYSTQGPQPGYLVTNITPNSAAIIGYDIPADLWGTNTLGQLGVHVGAGLTLVYGATSVADGATTAGHTSIKVLDSSSMVVGHTIIDKTHPTAIPPNTVVSSVPDGTHVVISNNTVATVQSGDTLLLNAQAATLQVDFSGTGDSSTNLSLVASAFSGSGTFTIPAGVFGCKVTLLGDGGGGGAGDGAGNVGAGGGQGAVGYMWLSGLTPGLTIAYAAGSGGAGSSAGSGTTISSGTQTISTVTAGGGGAGGDNGGSGGAGGTCSGPMSLGCPGNDGWPGAVVGGVAGQGGAYGSLGAGGGGVPSGAGSAGHPGAVIFEYTVVA